MSAALNTKSKVLFSENTVWI